MTNVSKQKLNEQIWQEIWEQLTETIGRLSVQQATPFMNELLTPSEQIMLAKRLAIIVLISEAHSEYAIAKTLKVSNTTVARIKKKYESNEFTHVLTGIKKNKNDYLEFINTLVVMIHMGLPRYAGPGRWKLLKK